MIIISVCLCFSILIKCVLRRYDKSDFLHRYICHGCRGTGRIWHRANSAGDEDARPIPWCNGWSILESGGDWPAPEDMIECLKYSLSTRPWGRLSKDHQFDMYALECRYRDWYNFVLVMSFWCWNIQLCASVFWILWKNELDSVPHPVEFTSSVYKNPKTLNVFCNVLFCI